MCGLMGPGRSPAELGARIRVARPIASSGHLRSGLLLVDLRRLFPWSFTGLFRNAFFILLREFVNYGLGFVFWLVVARYYVPADFGIAAALLGALTFLARGTDLGLPIGLLRFLPAEVDKTALFNGTVTVAGGFAFVLGVVFIAGIPLWSPALMFVQTDPVMLGVFVVSLIFFTIDGIVDNAFIAARRADYGVLRSGLFHGLRIPLVVGLAFLGVLGVASAWTLSLVVSVIGLAFLLPRFYPGYRPYPTVRPIRKSGILGFSLWTYASGIVSGAASSLLPLVILSLLPTAAGAEASAYFYAAFSFASLLYVLPAAFATALLVEGAHPETSYARDLRQTLRFSIPLLALALAATAFLGRWILGLFGPMYAVNGYIPLLILAAAAPVHLGVDIFTTRLRLDKEVKVIFIIGAASAAATLIMAWLFLPLWSIAGAAFAVLLGQLIAVPLFLLHWAIRRRRGPKARTADASDS